MKHFQHLYISVTDFCQNRLKCEIIGFRDAGGILACNYESKSPTGINLTVKVEQNISIQTLLHKWMFYYYHHEFPWFFTDWDRW